MIDAYYSGKVERISPEAPVPVVHVKSSEKRLGGAANVARNIKSLGARPILCSVIGDDLSALEFEALLEKEEMTSDGILKMKNHTTTVKTRVISGSQHMLRIDEEEIKDLSQSEKEKFLEVIRQILEQNKVDVVLFEDYDKGLLDKELIQGITDLSASKNIPTCVDPKKNNFLSYQNCTLFKPNRKELEEGLKEDLNDCTIADLDKAHSSLKKHLNHQMSFFTLSEKGVFISWESGSELIPAHVRNISDVSGAGDTVISVAALCLASGSSPQMIARIANLAGGLVCEKVGVVPIDKKHLLEESIRLYSS